jgi:hypothetical protein
MRTRIQELESRLNRRDADTKSTAKTELPVASQKLVGDPILPSQGAEQKAAGTSNVKTHRCAQTGRAVTRESTPAGSSPSTDL